MINYEFFMYRESTVQQLAFERSLYQKTIRSSARNDPEVVMFDGNIVVYKFISDVHFYVTAEDHENELILLSVLQGFFESVSLLLRGLVEKRSVLENLELGGKIMMVVAPTDDTAIRSFRNLPSVQLVQASELNAYDILCSDWLVFTSETLPGASS